jgi:hypothetical protein
MGLLTKCPGAFGSIFAGVVKLADTQDLGSCEETRGGSSPSARTMPDELILPLRPQPKAETRNYASYRDSEFRFEA